MRNLQDRILNTVIPQLATSIVERYGEHSTHIGELAAYALLSMSVADNHLHPNESADNVRFLGALTAHNLFSASMHPQLSGFVQEIVRAPNREAALREWAQQLPARLWLEFPQLYPAVAGQTNQQRQIDQIVFTLSGLSVVSYALLYALVSDNIVHKAELQLLNTIIRLFDNPATLYEHIAVTKMSPAAKNILFNELYRHVSDFTRHALIPLQLMIMVSRMHTTAGDPAPEHTARWAAIVDEVTDIQTDIIADSLFYAPPWITRPARPQAQPTQLTFDMSQGELFPAKDLTADTITALTNAIEDEDERVETAVALQEIAEAEHGPLLLREPAQSVESIPPVERVPRWEKVFEAVRTRPQLTYDDIEHIIAQRIAEPDERIDAYQYVIARVNETGLEIYDDVGELLPERAFEYTTIAALVDEVAARLEQSHFTSYSFEQQRFLIFHSILSASEERDLTTARVALQELAERTASVEDATRYRTLDARIRELLISHNYRLVMRCALDYFYSRNLELLDQMDLFQEGCIGLMRAIEKYDPTRGHKISTYATWWIRQSISRAIMDFDRGIRLPVHFLELIGRYHSAARVYRNKKGEDPSPEQIAQLLGISVVQAQRIVYWDRRIASLDQSVGEGDTSFGSLIPAESELEESAEHSMLVDVIQEKLHELPAREQQLIVLRFGLNGNKEHTLDEIGKLLGITRERVRQIESNTIKTWRRHNAFAAFLD